MPALKEKLCIKDIRTLKNAGLWIWQNRRSLIGYAAALTLLIKWAFGPVTTEQLTELIRAAATVINPVTLF